MIKHQRNVARLITLHEGDVEKYQVALDVALHCMQQRLDDYGDQLAGRKPRRLSNTDLARYVDEMVRQRSLINDLRIAVS